MSTIGQQHPKYRELMEGWELPQALMGGTRALRARGNQYLPRWPRETIGQHELRVKTSTLYNAFKRTVRVLSAKPFSDPVQIVEMPVELQVIENDVDRQGQTLTQFCRSALTDQLSYGLAHWLVDNPSFPPDLNRAQQQQLNVHPYFCRVDPTTLTYWRYVKGITGEQVLEEIQITTCETDDDGVEWEVVDQWTRDTIAQYKRKKAQGKNEEQWSLITEAPNPIGIVPLMTAYSDATKKGTMEGTSPLEDLAELNLKHYQSQSDQDLCLHYARVPFLHFAGFDENDVNKTIAVDNAFVSRSPDAKISWVEPTGKALEQGQADLDALESRMDVMGADLMVQKPGNPTATAKSIDTAEKVSDLQAMTISLEDTIEKSFAVAGLWVGQVVDPDSVDVQLNTNFGLSLTDAKEIDFLLKARIAGEISRELFYAEIQRRGLFEEFDTKEELKRVAVENNLDKPALPTGNA